MSEIPGPSFEIFWEGRPLFFTREIFIIEDDSPEVAGYVVQSSYEVYCPIPNAEMVEFGESSWRVIGQDLFFQRYRPRYEYLNDHHIEESDSRSTAIYKFPDKDFLIAISGSRYSKMEPGSKIPDRLDIELSEGVRLNYDADTGVLKSVKFDVPGQEPRHPVFGAEVVIDIQSPRAGFAAMGGFQPIDRKGNLIPLPESPGVTYSLLKKDGILLLKIRVDDKSQELECPLSLKIEKDAPLDLFINPESSDWVDKDFLDLLHSIKVTPSMVPPELDDNEDTGDDDDWDDEVWDDDRI